MSERPLRILQVSSSDISGGAQKVAWNLFQSYRMRGYGSFLAVGQKLSDDPDVLLISNCEGQQGWSRLWWAVHSRLRALDRDGRLSRLARKLAVPGVLLDSYRGFEDFRFPGTWRLQSVTPQLPEIVHCHNLHDRYFDLRVLSWLSHQVPTILTLHDAWLLSGHCAHSFNCERWRIGCGQCPDLTIYPAIRRDATAYNWKRKREIFARSRLYIASPSQWLMDKVEQSILAVAIVEERVIPNGVDLSVFHPADRQATREALGIAQDAKLLFFTAEGIRHNIWKDYETMRGAFAQAAGRLNGQRMLFIVLGEDGPTERFDQAEICFVPYLTAPEAVARYYQAADVYVHAAKVDTFPNTVLEALACGLPVVATNVGGIPEQIEDGVTGFLVPPADASAFASRIEQLLVDDALRRRMSAEAVRAARERFDLNCQASRYLEWYKAILESGKGKTFPAEFMNVP